MEPELLAVRDDQLGFGAVVFPAHLPGRLEKKPAAAGAGAPEAGNPALLREIGREVAQRRIAILHAAQQRRRGFSPGDFCETRERGQHNRNSDAGRPSLSMNPVHNPVPMIADSV